MTPGSADGSGGAQAVAGGNSSAEGVQADERYKVEQARADREATRARDLEAKLAALQSAGSGSSSESKAESFDPDALFDRWEAKMAHRDQMNSTAEALKGEFGFADADIFQSARDFDSPEALRAAVENSHKRVQTHVEAAREDERNRILAEVEAKHGIRLAPAPASSDAQAPAGDPTLEQLGAMSQAELDAEEAKNPGVIDRVLRTAY